MSVTGPSWQLDLHPNVVVLYLWSGEGNVLNFIRSPLQTILIRVRLMVNGEWRQVCEFEVSFLRRVAKVDTEGRGELMLLSRGDWVGILDESQRSHQ